MDPWTMAIIGANLFGSQLSAAQKRKQRDFEINTKAAEMEAQPFMRKDVQKTQVTTPISNTWSDLLGGGLNAASQIQAFRKAGLLDTSGTSGGIQKFDPGLDTVSPEEQEKIMEILNSPQQKSAWVRLASSYKMA